MIPFFRSSQNRIIGGVCGGIAEWVGVNPWVIRAVAVVILFKFGWVGTFYLLAWATVPTDGKEITKIWTIWKK